MSDFWRCPKGHEFYPQGNEPSVNGVAFTVSTRGYRPVATTGNICPHCYVEWIAANVPRVEFITEAKKVGR